MDTERERKHKGWYSRGYIPHFDQPGLIQAITFRLSDSLPLERRAEWEAWLDVDADAKRRTRLQLYLDRGLGACWLRDPRIARIVEGALLFADGDRYRLLAWVVMPNHVHALIETLPGGALDKIVHSWKSYTANIANHLLHREGAFWFREYYDRFIRDDTHFERAVSYIHANPVKAGLVERAEDWPFGSARLVPALDATFHAPFEERRLLGGDC